MAPAPMRATKTSPNSPRRARYRSSESSSFSFSSVSPGSITTYDSK